MRLTSDQIADYETIAWRIVSESATYEEGFTQDDDLWNLAMGVIEMAREIEWLRKELG